MDKEQAIIFDMDGVLIDNKKYHQEAWYEFSKRHQRPTTNADFQLIGFGKTNKEYLEHVLDRDVSDAEADQLGEEKEQLYRTIISQHLEPLKGLNAFLENLKTNAAFKLAVATSAPPSNLDFVMDKLGIRSFFDALVNSSYVSNGKPDPEIFLKAAELLKVNPKRCIVFEDSFFGIEAAHKAGMKVIGVATNHAHEELKDCETSINNFTEISLNTIHQILNKD